MLENREKKTIITNAVKFNNGYVLYQRDDMPDKYQLAKRSSDGRYVTLIEYYVGEDEVKEEKKLPVAKLYAMFGRINVAAMTGKQVLTDNEYGYDYAGAVLQG